MHSRQQTQLIKKYYFREENMDLNLKGKVVVVSAASLGLGEAIAMELAQEGEVAEGVGTAVAAVQQVNGQRQSRRD